MSDLMSRLRQIEDEDKKRKAQRDAEEAKWTSWSSPEERKAFYKYAARDNPDRDWYGTNNGKPRPTSSEFWNKAKLFKINNDRVNNRALKALDFGGDLSVNPTDYTEDYLQYHSDYVKKNGRPKNIQDVHKYATQQKYKGQYGNTVEDAQNELNGLKPMKYQVNDSVLSELNSYSQKALALQSNPNATRDDYQELFSSYKYLPQLSDYAKNQAEVKAKAKAAEEQKQADDPSYVPAKDFSLLTGTKAEKSPLDLDYLKSLGWDENTGFDWLVPSIPSRDDLARAASSQPGGLFTQQQSGAQQPQAGASPVVDTYVNLGARAAKPTPSKTEAEQLRETGWFGGNRVPDWIPDWYLKTSTLTKDIMHWTPGGLIKDYVLPVASVVMKNGLQALEDKSDGKKPQWQGNITAKGWENAPSGGDIFFRGWQKNIANGNYVLTGDKAQEQQLYNKISSDPLLSQLFGMAADVAYDPTTYIPGGVKLRNGLTTAGKAATDARLTAELEVAAQKVLAREQAAAQGVDALGGIKGAGGPGTTIRGVPGAQASEAAFIMPKPRQLEMPSAAARVERPTAMTPAELADLQGKGLRPQPRSLSGINAENEALAAERAAMEAQLADDAAGVTRLPANEYVDMGPQTPPADYYVSPYGVASDNMAPQLALPAGPQAEVIGRAGARGKFPQPRQFPSLRRLDLNEPYTSPAMATPRELPRSVMPAPRAVESPTMPQPRSLGNTAPSMPQRIVEAPTPTPEFPRPRQFNEPAVAAPEGMAERGLSENIRTDANSPDALRDSFSQDPEFYKVVSNKDTLERAQAVYDQGAQAARTQLTTLVDQMKPEAVPLAKMLARDAVQANKLDEAREILSSVASKLTESGQFGQAARILRQSDPETVLMTLDKQLMKLNADGAKVYGKKWKDFDLLADEAAELTKIKPGDEAAIEGFMNKVHDRIADQMPSTWQEKLTAWRHMSMLLNPKTHIRNIAGNALMAGVNRVSSRLSGVLQKVLPRDIRTAAPIVRKEAKQLAAEFFTKNEKDLMAGGNKYNEGIGINMPDKRVFNARPIEAVRKFNYAALDAEDKFFFSRAYKDRLASAMQARGIKSLDDVPQDILRLAKSEAEKAVFRDKSNLANAITKLKQSKGGFVFDTVMPFTKTPINIARRGLDFSPAGIGKGISKLFKPETAAEGIDDLAKGLTGTGVIALGYFLADGGVLTGAAPKDKDLAAYEKNTGNTPFEFTPLGITYDWAQPVAIPLAVGVAIHGALQQDPQAAAKLRRAIEAGDTETVKKMGRFYGAALLDSFKAAGDTMFNMSVLQGIQDLFNDPDGITAGLSKMPSNFVNQMIPTAFGQAARVIDPTVRQTYYGTGDVRTQTATVINKIPGASTLLPAKVTPFGQNQRGVENPILRTLNSFLNPGNMNTPQEIDPQVDAELRRLYNVGQLKQFPTTVDRSFKFMDRVVSLTDAEYTQYQRTTGQETIAAFKGIIASKEYGEIPQKELNERLKALAETRGTTVQALRNDSAALNRIQEEYRASLLAKGILYAKALGQLDILRKRGMVGNLTDKQLADRMGITKDIAKQIN